MWTRIYLYQVQIFGVSHGTREEAEQLIAWIRSGELKPVLHAAPSSFLNYMLPSATLLIGVAIIWAKLCIVPDAQWDLTVRLSPLNKRLLLTRSDASEKDLHITSINGYSCGWRC